MYYGAYGYGYRRRRAGLWVAVVLVLLGAGVFGAYKVGWLHRFAPLARAAQVDPAGKTPTEVGKGSGPAGQENASPTQPPADCAGPLPKRMMFNDPNIPTGGLGEWVEVKNDEGKVALRFKVDLLDAKLAGILRVGKQLTPMVLAKFGITVENRSCEKLAWNTRRPGFWLGTKKRIEKMPTYGWVHVDTDYSEKLFIPYKGSFYRAEEQDQTSVRLLIEHEFGGKWPVEFPEHVPAGETAYGEFFIKVMDVLGIDASPPVGPEGDGNLPLVIGGYESWARVNLGSAASWYEKFVGDPRDRSALPSYLTSPEGAQRND